MFCCISCNHNQSIVHWNPFHCYVLPAIKTWWKAYVSWINYLANCYLHAFSTWLLFKWYSCLTKFLPYKSVHFVLYHLWYTMRMSNKTLRYWFGNASLNNACHRSDKTDGCHDYYGQLLVPNLYCLRCSIYSKPLFTWQIWWWGVVSIRFSPCQTPYRWVRDPSRHRYRETLTSPIFTSLSRDLPIKMSLTAIKLVL